MLPGVAPVAIQEGEAAARNIERDLKKEPSEDSNIWTRGVWRPSAVLRRLHNFGNYIFPAIWLGWRGSSSTSFF